eukprot:scaffold114814_cov18-Tisochrysis_lutea.AAC.2
MMRSLLHAACTLTSTHGHATPMLCICLRSPNSKLLHLSFQLSLCISLTRLTNPSPVACGWLDPSPDTLLARRERDCCVGCRLDMERRGTLLP